MVFNSKQLEELENIHDSTGAFEEEADDESFGEDVGEAAMDWRRGLIEEAAENMKRARARPVEPHLTYAISSMLFDRDARRFARVQRSVPGYLKIVYLSGGDREFGTLDVTAYLRENGANRRASELAEQLGMSELDVMSELDRLNIIPLDELDEPEAVAAPEAPAPLPAFLRKKAAPIEDEEDEEESSNDEVDDLPVAAGDDDDDVVDDDDEDGPPVRSKAPARGAPPTKKAPIAAPVRGKSGPPPLVLPAPQRAAAAPAPSARGKAVARPAPAAAKPVAGGKLNAIDDPNGYIRAKYQELSNRELAKATGLSEHTIRRKLGEWGLKRRKDG
jgi:hypothetical protein